MESGAAGRARNTMYESYWQLRAKPFESTGDAAFFYPSEAHQGSLLKLRYAIENRRSAALLVGAAGVGKTLIVRSLRQYLGDAYGPLVHLVFPELTAGELLAYVARGLGAKETSVGEAGVDRRVHAIEQVLADHVRRGKHAVVIIDEAHRLAGTPTFEALRLLTNFDIEGRPALTMLLVGQTPLLAALDRMPQLEERLAVKTLLRPLSAEETRAYVEHRLRAAGAERELFDSAALEAVHELAHGVPRRINRLCDLSLLIGYAEEQPIIGAAQVENVSHELVSISPE